MEGTIIKGIGGFYYVKTEIETIECKPRGKFRYDGLTPIVGDRVRISIEGGKGVIEEIFERSSELIRPLVSNVTQAFVVFAAKNPDINKDLLNRFLVLCEYNNIKANVCLNKIDLCSEEELRKFKEGLNNIGYELIPINAKEGYGLEKLNQKLKNNVTVLCGPSGAGKSTLLNKLTGKTLMETGEVSKKVGRGKHTTRHSELIEIEHGFIVDTPGFSNIDITFIDEYELQNCFPEFKDFNGKCKFSSCVHNKEPKCAVKEAVEGNKISELRYDFYIKTLEEIQRGKKRKW
ncbi:ribosome small subunit-dependent GTPase A [Clostridium frigidicarnis]|uniref:Small ribosomal subunit biogenesis GTPase RsgA n=1 Tax=Clostridium frigidicarnis TaxID=84698 RepID=A0A1I0ZM72_9CLOT|nr:ribosome small subunit-dependent GTPase A [Clostridium frigidicarnis]SFB26909.1 ribosome biogenesis GTPase [Clostridium frigidicarnis]